MSRSFWAQRASWTSAELRYWRQPPSSTLLQLYFLLYQEGQHFPPWALFQRVITLAPFGDSTTRLCCFLQRFAHLELMTETTSHWVARRYSMLHRLIVYLVPYYLIVLQVLIGGDVLFWPSGLQLILLCCAWITWYKVLVSVFFFPALALAIVSHFLGLQQVLNREFLSLRALFLLFVTVVLRACCNSHSIMLRAEVVTLIRHSSIKRSS